MTKCTICHNHRNCPTGMKTSHCGRFITDFDTICIEAMTLSTEYNLSIPDTLCVMNMILQHQEA